MSVNPKSVAGQGEFHSSVPGSKPLEKSGHQLGRQVGREAVPEFHAETHPPGSAPAEATYQPHVRPADTRQPPSQQQAQSQDPLSMPGATSGEVHSASTRTRPMEGQTSRELRSNRNERAGLEGVGATASEETVEGRARVMGADLPEGIYKGMKGKESRAEGKEGASAEEVAAEEGRKK
ncbi:hypothetical protein VTJ49DRAFT_7749 [Mycothermus thermophilus]|uniref:Uncharacterized protein n=1 Tax=Humicola insolens TaxID=85995 RepID=A0ABR3VG11_HUMIN